MKIIRHYLEIHPLCVLIMAFIGGAIGWGLFQIGYKPPAYADGKIPPEFWVWLFLIACYFALLSVFLLPIWSLFLTLYKKQVAHEQNPRRKFASLILLALSAVFLVFILMAPYLMVLPIHLDALRILPTNFMQRLHIMSLYSFVVVLPLGQSIFLVFSAVQKMMIEIRATDPEDSHLFEIANKLVHYRGTLQNLLLVAGIILSMIPIITAELRAVLIKLGGEFPIEYVIIYGLYYTLVLILIYSPTHLLITEASRTVRDRLYPISNKSHQIDAVEGRMTLDELLQINLGLGQNLKDGIVTLAPLVTSLITSLFGNSF